MNQHEQRSPRRKTTFHFEPASQVSHKLALFHVIAELPQGGQIIIGETHSRNDAVALTRLISAESGIVTRIFDVREEFQQHRRQKRHA